MRLSIIGARRSRNGIGEYIGKYFHKWGAIVTSVLGTTKKTSHDAASSLRKYGIEPTPYTDFEEMVERESPDTIIIASPTATHYQYLMKSIDSDLNVFCEKPFIWYGISDLGSVIADIFKRAREKDLTLTMNSQWPFALKFYQKMCGRIDPKNCQKFFISLAPSSFGKEMISESVPHALSILYFLLKDGRILNLNFTINENKKIIIVKFKYVSEINNCEVTIRLAKKEDQPRDFIFGFNDRVVTRILDLDKYNIYLNYKSEKLGIVDPLELSVKHFITSIEKANEPFIGYAHILNNMSLLKEICDCYEGI